MFRRLYPLAWTFHQHSSRWTHNTLRLDENRREAAPFREDPAAQLRPLPPASLLPQALGQVIYSRMSCRQFQPVPIRLEHLSSVLHHSYGVLDHSTDQTEMLHRPVPSGGALYPLELSVLCRAVSGLPAGMHHYVPLYHALEEIQLEAPPQNYISTLFMHQPYVADAACIVVLSFMPARSLWKYEDRGYRYALFEAGHVAQNMNLVAAALGLGSVNLGGFFDTDLAELLRLETNDEVPLYAVALGVPRALDQHALRVPATL